MGTQNVRFHIERLRAQPSARGRDSESSRAWALGIASDFAAVGPVTGFKAESGACLREFSARA